jgi:phosphonate transport system ATP-binding protein
MSSASGNGASGTRWAVRGENLRFAYRGKPPVIDGVSVAVPAGAFWTVFGPSGAGKTTLLKLLAGLLPVAQGRVEVLGADVTGGVPRELRLKVGYIPQQLGLVRGLTALENVLLGSLGRNGGLRALLGHFAKAERDRARELLALVGIEAKAGERAFRLSGGERQRVAIARTLLQEPRVIFADEFVSDLDLPRATQVLETMRRLAEERGITFLINLHELETAQLVADHALILNRGAIVHQGPAGELSPALLHAALA